MCLPKNFNRMLISVAEWHAAEHDNHNCMNTTGTIDPEALQEHRSYLVRYAMPVSYTHLTLPTIYSV